MHEAFPDTAPWKFLRTATNPTGKQHSSYFAPLLHDESKLIKLPTDKLRKLEKSFQKKNLKRLKLMSNLK